MQVGIRRRIRNHWVLQRYKWSTVVAMYRGTPKMLALPFFPIFLFTAIFSFLTWLVYFGYNVTSYTVRKISRQSYKVLYYPNFWKNNGFTWKIPTYSTNVSICGLVSSLLPFLRTFCSNPNAQKSCYARDQSENERNTTKYSDLQRMLRLIRYYTFNIKQVMYYCRIFQELA